MTPIPTIDRRVLQIGMSKLRDMDSAWLRNFNESDKICVLNAGTEAVAVMVPYKMFIEMQTAITGFNRLVSEGK